MRCWNGSARTHGRIDGLVNNAGVHREGGLLDSDEATIRLVTEINQYGVIFGMAAVAPIMRDQGAGSVVNISSISGMRGHGSIAYVGSKWAVRGMTKSAAHELVGSGCGSTPCTLAPSPPTC